MKKNLLLSIFFLLLFAAGNYAQAQTRTVSGTVIAKDDGLPMPGVSVVAKGPGNIGTQTSSDGKYSLNLPAGTTALIFRFIGTRTVEVPLTGGNVYNVTLISDFKLLNEIVVTGAGVATSKTKLGI
ncbi:MAG: carboxypeptidase-like regulatory domain-containing protein, partial [Mucilaginibacter sp.]